MLNVLKLGKEYTKSQLAEELGVQEILENFGGIAETKNFVLLFITMDKTHDAELPMRLEDMPRLDRYNHNYPYLDVFDMEQRTFNWDSPVGMNIESPIIQQFVKKKKSWFLFVRKYYQRWANDNNPNLNFFYCGEIEYHSHKKGTAYPVHIISTLKEVLDNPASGLKQIYNWRPKNYKIRLDEFRKLENLKMNLCEKFSSQQEGNRLEFKETFFGNKERGENDTIKDNCLKTICGFLNRSGGNLIIGVRDEEEHGIHNITGVEFDVNYISDNDYLDRLQNSIRFALDDGGIINQHIKVELSKCKNGKQICVIEVQQLPNSHHSELYGDIYVRQNATTPKLSRKKHVEWLKNRK